VRIATVLLAEDDLNDAFLVRRAFKKADLPHRLVHLLDGQQAIEYLSGAALDGTAITPGRPDLLLLDLKMPKVGGFEVLAWLQQRPELKSMPVVVLSSSDHESDVRQARALGAADYFRKPGDPSELIGIVRTLHERWLSADPPGIPAVAA